jgi:hypothetical protein
VADILRNLRTNSTVPIFQIYRYPLIEGYEQFTNADSDSDLDADPTQVTDSTKGINQQLDFSIISSEDVLTELTNDEPETRLPAAHGDQFETTEDFETQAQNDRAHTPVLADHLVSKLNPVNHWNESPPISPPKSPIAFLEQNSRLTPIEPASPVSAPAENQPVNSESYDSDHASYEDNLPVLEPEIEPVPELVPSPVRNKQPSVQVNYQSPKPFKSPDQLVISICN